MITVPFTFVATIAAIEYAGAQAGVRGRRARLLHDGSGQARGGDHAADEGRSCRCISTDSPPTWTRSWRSRAGTGCRDRGRGAGARGRVLRPPMRVDGRRWPASASIPARTSAPTARAAPSSPAIPRWRARSACCGAGARRPATSTRTAASTTGWTASRAPCCGVKLRHLERWTEARRAHAAEYARQLAGTAVTLPVERAGARHVYHLYVVRLADRDRWRARLSDAGVQTGVHYPIPVHLQPAYRDLGYAAGRFPRGRSGGARGVVAADLPGVDRAADRRGGVGAPRARLPRRGRLTWTAPTADWFQRCTGGGRSSPIASTEVELADRLRARPDARSAAGSASRHAYGDDQADAVMRRATWRALAKRFGHGVRIGRGAIVRHPETFEIGDGVLIGEQAFIQGRFDGRCVIGARAWIGPQAYLDARDLVIEESVGWGPGAKVLGSEHTGSAGRRADHRNRPGDRAGADLRLGRHRRQRRDPAGRHDGQGRHRRRRRGGHPRRRAVRDRRRRAGAVPALARRPRRRPGSAQA